MSLYSSIAVEFDGVMREAFSSYQEAEKAFDEARRQRDKTPVRAGQPYDEAIIAHKLEIRYQEAKQAFESVKRELPDATRKTVGALRQRLVEAVNEDNKAHPEDIDDKTMMLVNSDILRADEVDELIKNSNTTMRRILSKYCDQRAAALEAKYGATDPEARRFREAAYNGSDDGQLRIKAFDTVSEIADKCWQNSSMMDYWPSLTESTLQSF